MSVRRLEQERGWAFAVAVGIIKPLLLLVTRRSWRHGEKIPATGGCIVVVNHLSHADPLTTAHLLYDHGRLPRYLAKAGLFSNRALGFFLRSAGQIPVQRLSHDAVGAYDAAVAAVESGECVVVYPEGTITRDADLWPMVGKTGAARIALATGCPVVPVAHWGIQELLPPYGRPDLLPPKRIHYLVGDPVPLEDLRERPPSAAVTREATERIMAAITDLLAELRGEEPPPTRFDPRVAGVRPIGNPHRVSRRRKGRRHG